MKSGTVRFSEFRIYTGNLRGQGLYVYARVFATKREMLAAVNAEERASGGKPLAHNTLGVMQSFTKRSYAKNGQGRTSACIGRVNLFKRGLDTETIVHEFGHAMFAWAGRMKLLGQLDQRGADLTAEEQLCYVLGRMVNRFVYHARQKGLYS